MDMPARWRALAHGQRPTPAELRRFEKSPTASELGYGLALDIDIAKQRRTGAGRTASYAYQPDRARRGAGSHGNAERWRCRDERLTFAGKTLLDHGRGRLFGDPRTRRREQTTDADN
jgi:hypothetical protein